MTLQDNLTILAFCFLSLGFMALLYTAQWGGFYLTDIAILAIGAGPLLCNLLHIHPAFALIIGLVLSVFLLLVSATKYGFWITCVLSSLFWSYIFSIVAYVASGEDMIWTYVIFGVGILLMIGLHVIAWCDHVRDEYKLLSYRSVGGTSK